MLIINLVFICLLVYLNLIFLLNFIEKVNEVIWEWNIDKDNLFCCCKMYIVGL